MIIEGRNFEVTKTALSEDLKYIADYNDLPYEEMGNSTVLVTGATGLIGVSLVRALLAIGKIHVNAFVRNIEKAKKIYGDENKIFIIIDKENRYEESNVISLSEFRKVQENSIKKYLFCRPEQHTSEGLGKLSNILWNNNIYAPFYITKEVVSPGLKGNINPNFVYENIVSIIKILKKLEDREK